MKPGLISKVRLTFYKEVKNESIWKKLLVPAGVRCGNDHIRRN